MIWPGRQCAGGAVVCGCAVVASGDQGQGPGWRGGPWVARLLTARGRPRAASWMRVMASLNRGSERQGEFEVLGDVFGDLPAFMVYAGTDLG